MKGFIRTTTASLCLGASSLSILGCTAYRDHVDPCYPERYNYESRRVIRDTFDAQAFNGHVLDQTIWNYHFEKDDKGNPTDRLTAAGQEKLNYLIRRRPAPDGKLYLQTSNDLQGPVTPEQFPAKRSEVDTKRVAAIQRYLSAQMAGRSQPVAFDVAIHDPAEVYLPASVVGGTSGVYAPVGAYPRLTNNFQGTVTVGDPFTIGAGTGGGGGSGGGGSGSGGSGSQGQQGGAGGQAGAAPGSN